MHFYLGIYVLTIFISIMCYNRPTLRLLYGKKKYEIENKNIFLFIIGIFLIVILGIRGLDTGADTRMYGRIFHIFAEVPLFEHLPESITGFWGYRLFCKIIGICFEKNYTVFLLGIAILTIGIILYFIKCCSENYYLSVVMFISTYMYFNCFNAMRQYGAISLCLLAFVELQRKRYIRSILVMIFACMFHNSAIIMFLIYPLSAIQWNYRKLAVYTLCLIIGCNMMPYLIFLFVKIFPRYGNIYAGFVKTGGAAGWNLVVQGRKALVSVLFLIVILTVFFLTYEKDMEKGFASNWLIMPLMIAEIVIGIIFRRNYFVLRFQMYFDIFMIVGIPNCISRLNIDVKSKNIYSLMLGAALTIPFLVQLAGNYAKIIPYTTFWQ